MARCPSGHDSRTNDYCDVCGAPIGRLATVTPLHPQVQLVKTCPVCETDANADALFCEACGYDFTTGAKPGDPPRSIVQTVAPSATQGELPPTQPQPTTQVDVVTIDRPQPSVFVPAGANTSVPGVDPTIGVGIGTGSAVRKADALFPEMGRWVVEQWIDPEWYATQEADAPIPSPGPPIVTEILTKNTLIGRPSENLGVHPRINCDPDTGVSRRQAELSTDGQRWWVRDFESANGTFLGRVDTPLPAMPIKGRVELSPDERIYVGMWTRLVVRPAMPGELSTNGR